MGLNPLELSFAKEHYSDTEVVKISHATREFGAFAEEYIYKYDKYLLGNLIRVDSYISQQFKKALSSLEPYSDNLIAKCHLAELYSYYFNYDYYQKALEYAREGAEAGLAEAQLLYGTLLLNRKETKNALHWFELASSQGHPIAKCEIAALRWDEFADDDYQRKMVIKMFREAATESAIYYLAGNSWIYENDFKWAISALNTIKDNYPKGYYGLGNIYSSENKNNPYKDYLKAYDCYLKSAKYGSYKSYEMLAVLCNNYIRGAESAEYWIDKAISYRKLRDSLEYERDHVHYKPEYVVRGAREIYNKRGYYDLPEDEIKRPPIKKNNNSSFMEHFWTIIFWIIVVFLFVKFCR